MRTPLIIFVAALIVTSPSAAWAGGKGGGGGGGGGGQRPTGQTSFGYGQMQYQYSAPRTGSGGKPLYNSLHRGVHLPRAVIEIR
jgi:hypothetical protein